MCLIDSFITVTNVRYNFFCRFLKLLLRFYYQIDYGAHGKVQLKLTKQIFPIFTLWKT